MKSQFSAGGVVFKKENNKTYILIAQHSQHHGWVFPKGFIGDKIANEGKEETAIREVEEETGVFGKIIKPLSPSDYWYVLDGEKIKKTVYYFLMTVIREDISNHDKEMENVEWLEAEKIEKHLTYPSEKKVWQEAKQYITNKCEAWAGITTETSSFIDLAHKFIRATKWRGGCELEIMQTTDGISYIMEVNPRFPAWIYLSAAAGQNQPVALVKMALGETVEPFKKYEVGKMFIRYSWDLITDVSEFQTISGKGEL